LLDAKADACHVFTDRHPPLFYARCPHTAALLIAFKADVNWTGPYLNPERMTTRMTVLGRAVERNPFFGQAYPANAGTLQDNVANVQLVRVLIRAKADLVGRARLQPNVFGLSHAKADVVGRDMRCHSPLQILAQQPSPCLATARVLIDAMFQSLPADQYQQVVDGALAVTQPRRNVCWIGSTHSGRWVRRRRFPSLDDENEPSNQDFARIFDLFMPLNDYTGDADCDFARIFDRDGMLARRSQLDPRFALREKLRCDVVRANLAAGPRTGLVAGPRTGLVVGPTAEIVVKQARQVNNIATGLAYGSSTGSAHGSKSSSSYSSGSGSGSAYSSGTSSGFGFGFSSAYGSSFGSSCGSSSGSGCDSGCGSGY
jgi:hypothetical protein